MDKKARVSINIIILILVILVVFLSNFGLSYCYQESANETDQTGKDGSCGLQYTGSYAFDAGWANPENLIDGDWGTTSSVSGDINFYMNYTKPDGASSSSLWEVKDTVGTENLSINANCMVQSILQFRMFSDGGASGTRYADWYCWDGSVWQNLRSQQTPFEGYVPYEEAMLWDISNSPNIDYISDISRTEDFSQFTLDLSANISDVEDADSDLTFEVDLNDSSVFSLDVNNATDVFTFTSTANQSGVVNVSVIVYDTGGLSNSTSFDLIVSSINDAPWANGKLSNVTLSEDFGNIQAISVSDINANFSDVEDATPNSYKLISSTNTSSTCYFDASNNFDCDSLANLSSTDYYTFELNDSSLESVRYNFQVTINSVNDNPWNDGLSNPSNVNEDSGTNDNVITVAQLDTTFRDVEEDQSPSTYEISSQSNTTAINCALDGSFNIDCTTQANQSGSNTVTVKLGDSGGLFTYPTFTIVVDAVNDNPWIDNILTNITMNENNGTSTVFTQIELDNNFRDVEEDQNPFTTVILSESDTSIIDCSIVANNLQCTTGANQSGSSDVVLNYTDTNGLSIIDSILFTVNAVNDNPYWEAIPNGTIAITEDTANQNVTIGYQDYFRDVEDDQNPTLSIISDNETDVTCAMDTGDIECSPVNNFTGVFILTINGSDSGGLSALTSFEINVSAVNDNPWWDLIGNSTATNINEDGGSQSILGNYNTYFNDVEQNNIPINPTFSTNESDITCTNSTNDIYCTPSNNFTGSYIIKILASDNSGYTINQSFENIIDAVNDNPWWNTVLSNITSTEDFSTLNNIIPVTDLNSNFSDVEEDGNPTYYELTSISNTSSSCFLDGSNNIDCSSVANQSGIDYYRIYLNDSSALSTKFDFQITITAVNDIHWIDSFNETNLNRTEIWNDVNTTIYNIENETLNFSVEIADVESETHWYSWFFDGVRQAVDTALNSFTKYFDFFSAGSHNVTATINDSDGNEINQEWNITISNVEWLGVSGETYSVIDGTTAYNNNSLYLNATFSGVEGGIDTVWISGNWSGAYVNYTNATLDFISNGYTFSYFLDSGNYSNQDNFTWIYYANDTNGYEISAIPKSVFIPNRNATIKSGSVAIIPDPALSSNDLNCSINSTWDYDGEAVGVYYEWYNYTGISYVIIPNVKITESNLSSGNISTGDKIKCRAIPYDTYENGSYVDSQLVTIGSANVAPLISQVNATTQNTTILSNSSNPTNNNSAITFSVGFTDSVDAEADGFNAYFCKTNDFTYPSTCDGGEWTKNESGITDTVLTAEYEIQDSEILSSYDYYAFVTDNNTVSSSLAGTFNVNHPPLNLSILAPLNESYSNKQGTYINFTADDDDGDTITYLVYISNTTVPPTSFVAGTVINYYNFTNNELTYYWFIEARDEHGYYDGNSSMRYYSVDYTRPNNTITASNYASTSTGQTATITLEQSDNSQLDSCYYKLSSLGSPTSYTKTPCNSIMDLNATNLLISEATYTFDLISNDTYGNENESSITFTTSKAVSGGGTTGGGGGDTSVILKLLGEDCTINTECNSELCDLSVGSDNYGTCQQTLCGNGVIDEGEDNNNCPEDVGAFQVPEVQNILIGILAGIAFFIALLKLTPLFSKTKISKKINKIKIFKIRGVK